MLCLLFAASLHVILLRSIYTNLILTEKLFEAIPCLNKKTHSKNKYKYTRRKTYTDLYSTQRMQGEKNARMQMRMLCMTAIKVTHSRCDEPLMQILKTKSSQCTESRIQNPTSSKPEQHQLRFKMPVKPK